MKSKNKIILAREKETNLLKKYQKIKNSEEKG